MVDIDAPQEVIAASGRFAGAITSVTDRVGAISGDLALPSRPESMLDDRLGAVNRWIAATLANARIRQAHFATATHQQATNTTNMLADAETTGAAAVYGSGPV